MSNEKQRSEDAMGRTVGAGRETEQAIDEAAMGRGDADARVVQAEDEVAMGKPATAEQLQEKASEETAMGEVPSRRP